MPTNVTPEYAVAEREYQQASTNAEKLRCLEKMLSTCPTHKGCEGLRAEIKSKISRLKNKLKREREQKKKGFSLAVKKEGAAQVVLVGPPNSGKSTLLKQLTGAKVEIADYPFTTIKPEIGMMDVDGIKIQIIEIPAITRDFEETEQGPTFLSIIKTADLMVWLYSDSEEKKLLKKESNDKIRGKGSYDKALFAMKRLSENGILDCIVTTMTKHNIKEMEHPAELAAEYGARMVVYHNLVPVGRAETNMPDLAPTPEEYEAAFNQIYDLQVAYRERVKVNVYAPFYARIVRQRNPTDFWDWFQNGFLGKCTIGGNYISVTENGDYRSCGFHESYRLGNVKNKGLRKTWEELQHSEFHLRLRDKSNIKGKCGICEYREICGGCRTRAEYYTGDLLESDPACAYIPKVLREEKRRAIL